MTTEEAFESWAIVELMGHRRIGGLARSPGGAGGLAGTLRVDIHELCPCDCAAPRGDGESAEVGPEVGCEDCHGVGIWDKVTTQFYGSGAVYCLTPTTEQVARGVARGFHRPVGAYHPAVGYPSGGDAAGSPDDDYGDEAEF